VTPFVLAHSRPSHRLNHEMNVYGHGMHVRPQGDVHLLGSLKRSHDCRRLPKHHTELRGLCCLEVSNMYDVAIGFDDQRPDAERAHAMVDEPMLRLVDTAAGRSLQGNGFTCAAVGQETNSRNPGRSRVGFQAQGTSADAGPDGIPLFAPYPTLSANTSAIARRATPANAGKVDR
jgi:hypothetical protein